MKTLLRREGRKGQAAVEYMLSTMMILVLFTSLYAVLQRQTKKLFVAAAKILVRSYYE